MSVTVDVHGRASAASATGPRAARTLKQCLETTVRAMTFAKGDQPLTLDVVVPIQAAPAPSNAAESQTR